MLLLLFLFQVCGTTGEESSGRCSSFPSPPSLLPTSPLPAPQPQPQPQVCFHCTLSPTSPLLPERKRAHVPWTCSPLSHVYPCRRHVTPEQTGHALFPGLEPCNFPVVCRFTRCGEGAAVCPEFPGTFGICRSPGRALS